MDRNTCKAIAEYLNSTETMFYKNGKAKFTVFSSYDDREKSALADAKKAEIEYSEVAKRIEQVYGVSAKVKRLRYQGFINIVNIVAE